MPCNPVVVLHDHAAHHIEAHRKTRRPQDHSFSSATTCRCVPLVAGVSPRCTSHRVAVTRADRCSRGSSAVGGDDPPALHLRLIEFPAFP